MSATTPVVPSYVALTNFAVTIAYTVLFGIDLLLLSYAMVLMHRKRVLWRSLQFISITIILLAICADAVVIWYLSYAGFVKWPEGPGAYFAMRRLTPVDKSWIAANDLSLIIASVAGDTLMIWRAWHVWGRDRRILYLPGVVLPLAIIAALWSVVNDTLIGTSYALKHAESFKVKQHVLPTVSFIAPITITIYTTALICWKIWSVNRAASQLHMGETNALESRAAMERRQKPYYKITRALVQSGMLYSVSSVMLLIYLAVKTYVGRNIVGGLQIVILGLTTALVVIQLNGGIMPDTGVNNSENSRSLPLETFSMPVFRARDNMTAKDKTIMTSDLTATTREYSYGSGQDDERDDERKSGERQIEVV